MFNNPWFVGVVAGIPSGLIVWGITALGSYFFSKKAYYRQVDKVNNEITNLLIMSVAEEKIPHYKIIISLLDATSRQNNLKSNDIKSVEQTYNDLIKAVFETNFIAIDKKEFLSEEIEKRKAEFLVENKNDELIIISDNFEERIKGNRYMELILSLISILATLIVFLDFTSDISLQSLFKDEIFIFLLSVITSLGTATILAALIKYKKNR